MSEEGTALGSCVAVIHGEGVNAKAIVEYFGQEQAARGYRVLGLAPHQASEGRAWPRNAILYDLSSGESFPFAQLLGEEQMLAQHVDLLVVGEFDEREAGGGNPLDVIRMAAAMGIPVLTAIHQQHADRWAALDRGYDTPVTIDPEALSLWWRQAWAIGMTIPAEATLGGERTRPPI